MNATTIEPRKRTGQSRDLSKGSMQSSRLSTLAPPQRPVVTRTVTAPQRRFQHKSGSKQQFTHRGRRIERPQANRRAVYTVVGFTLLILLGFLAASIVSGVTTQQAFRITELRIAQQTLDNQLETLNRDVERAAATGQIARQAQRYGMVIPDQPGVLVRNPDGTVVEQRPPSDRTRPITDINDEYMTSNIPTSDPLHTQGTMDQQTTAPIEGPVVADIAPYTAGN
ncbi:hypothetical protein N7326_02100 [Corynebacterium sp. ES2794-CONJ1]|uniref:hypothetical protein n=1 Tax=unclassified Corynebacterium TaxID=2624378 RepID=UPI002169F4B4|nr:MULTISPECIES: hypothetical protein [unclassified Corynebacterium]MCS4489008.1 hypothetical protein [Corynebacterium sp. ES2775-CONJ]MCS4490821.1 hypothetical protein [Corynebacterium sp. ES2715-CONJ3]MCS4531296.1 hypothetical protein [Corynebacterium sp. ES2730-CONJ]MCU9518665.1 hypothetical protein [Corynebacterium sp. ES2794-CONJ1]